MIGLIRGIALKDLLARRRQSLVSLSGIVLGVAFFLAVSSLMQGSERDFIRRLVDNSPHITIERVPQPATAAGRRALSGRRDRDPSGQAVDRDARYPRLSPDAAGPANLPALRAAPRPV